VRFSMVEAGCSRYLSIASSGQWFGEFRHPTITRTSD